MMERAKWKVEMFDNDGEIRIYGNPADILKKFGVEITETKLIRLTYHKESGEITIEGGEIIC